VLDQHSAAAIEALVEADVDRAALNEAMSRMSTSERAAVELRVVGELEYSEIAAQLGCSEGAARTRVHRGLARLSDLMETSS
jgi:RNA polymerase sigma factor (sigma-70 family)